MFCTCTCVASWFVMLHNALMSSLDFVSSFKMIFIHCLLTWVSYWVKFSIETMCTIVFC